MDKFLVIQVFLILAGIVFLVYGTVLMVLDYLIDGRLDHLMRWIEDICYGILILILVALVHKQT